jgi:hypothetical protein
MAAFGEIIVKHIAFNPEANALVAIAGPEHDAIVQIAHVFGIEYQRLITSAGRCNVRTIGEAEANALVIPLFRSDEGVATREDGNRRVEVIPWGRDKDLREVLEGKSSDLSRSFWPNTADFIELSTKNCKLS